jgi:hypothetical protein
MPFLRGIIPTPSSFHNHLVLVWLLAFWTIKGTRSQVVDEQTILNPSLAKNCTESVLLTNEIVDGEIKISSYDALSNNEFPMTENLNASAWELWYFDAVSSSGDAAVMISFFRDGSQSRMGKGSLRTTLQAIWPDGSTFGTEHYADESIIKACPEETMEASWRGGESSASFEISHGLNEALVQFDLAAVKGSLSLSSLVPAFLEDGNTDLPAEASQILTPTVYWLQPIPRASVDVALNIDGKELSFTGSGGHDRFWTPFSWMTLMD